MVRAEQRVKVCMYHISVHAFESGLARMLRFTASLAPGPPRQNFGSLGHRVVDEHGGDRREDIVAQLARDPCPRFAM